MPRRARAPRCRGRSRRPTRSDPPAAHRRSAPTPGRVRPSMRRPVGRDERRSRDSPRACRRERRPPAARARRPASTKTRTLMRPPACCITSTTRGAAFGPAAEHLGLLALALRHDEAQLLELRRRAASRVARRPACGSRAASPAPTGSAAGSAPPSRSRPPAAARRRRRGRRRLLLAARAPVLDRQPLQPGHDGQPERVRDADADLVVARVRRLVAEDDQVEAAASPRTASTIAPRRRLRVPLLAR